MIGNALEWFPHVGHLASLSRLLYCCHGARGALDAAPTFMQLSKEAAASGRSSRASSRASSRNSSRDASPQHGVVAADAIVPAIVPASAGASALTNAEIYGMVETLAAQSAGEDLSQFGWRCYWCL